jgi:hypothetical protein
VGREDDGRIARRDFVEFVDEDRALPLEAFDHVLVVHDLVTNIDRRAVARERLLDHVDGAHDAGAEPARRAQKDDERGFAGCGHDARCGERRRGVSSGHDV